MGVQLSELGCKIGRRAQRDLVDIDVLAVSRHMWHALRSF